MKSKIKLIIAAALFSILNIACQEKSKLTSEKFKNEIISALNKIENPILKEHRREIILDSLYVEILKKESDTIQRNLLFKVADKHYFANRFDKYKMIIQKTLKLAKEDNDSVFIAKSLHYLGDYYEKTSQADSAFTFYNRAEKYYTNLGDTLNIGKMKLFKACLLLDNGIFTQSETEGIIALKILSTQNNPRLLHTTYNVIALSLNELNEPKKSLEYFNLSLKQLKDKKYPKEDIILSKANGLNSIGRVYEKTKNYKEAIKFYKKGLSIENLKSLYPYTYAMLIDNLGHSLVKFGQIHQGYPFLIKGLHIRENLDTPLGIANSKNNIGEYFLAANDTIDALKYTKEGLYLAKKIKSSDLSLQALELLMNNDKANKEYYTKQYIKTKDSLQQLELINKNKFARIAFETEEIEKENSVLSKRIAYIIIIALAVLTISIFIIVFIRLKAKNRELLFIKEQQEANEKIYQLMIEQQTQSEATRLEERNRIAMELHDGIINRVFTTRYNLDRLIPDHIEVKERLFRELEDAEAEIRQVSHDLKQNLNFEDHNLQDMIKNLINSQHNHFNTQFGFSSDKLIDWSKIPSSHKINIFRIIQESIQNINKYSQAERAVVFILKLEDNIILRIWDNGIGFNPEKTKQGIGLKNIKERAKAINGALTITSDQDKGTTIEVVFATP